MVRRLILAAAACRLSPSGRQLLTQVARLVHAGDPRRASALVAGTLAPRPLGYPGSADRYYSEGLFRRTATGIAGGQVVIFPRKGHLYAGASKTAADIALGFELAG